MASIDANLRSKISLAELQIQQFQRQSNSNEVRNINFTKAPLISSQNVSNFEIRVSKPQFHYDNVPTAVNQNWSVDMVQNVSRNVSLMNSRADSSQNSTNLNFYKSKYVKVDENAVHSVGDPKGYSSLSPKNILGAEKSIVEPQKLMYFKLMFFCLCSDLNLGSLH
ncbi:hypothetical protein FXO37_18532 [Capsicum annuum]|nr:hypothetical protein FXO37_18532 [Capsicum annuum]